MKVKTTSKVSFFTKEGLDVDQHPMKHHNMDGSFSKSFFSIHSIIPIHYTLVTLLLPANESDLY